MYQVYSLVENQKTILRQKLSFTAAMLLAGQLNKKEPDTHYSYELMG